MKISEKLYNLRTTHGLSIINKIALDGENVTIYWNF